MKRFAPLAVVVLFAANSRAQTEFPLDSVSHTVTVKQTFKLNPKASTDDVFTISKDWFEAAEKFTQQNTGSSGDTLKNKKNKNQLTVDKEFDNHHPLQMLDPAGGKLLGLGILKYSGGGTGIIKSTGSSIKLLYIKYDISISITGGSAGISVSNVRYFHFDGRSFALTSLYGLSGGKPCEETGKIEDLISCEKFPDEFKNVAVYFNQQVNNLLADYKNTLKLKKALYDPKAVPPAPAAAKTPVKKK